MKSKISGIYCITNKINGKKYIGQSTNIEQRLKQHTTKNRCKFAIGNAIEKYGIESFTFDIIAKCPPNCLDELEIVFIRELKTLTPSGYNISAGGDAFMKGRKFTEEHKQKISKGNRGKKRTDEMNLAQSKRRLDHFSKPQGKLTKEKISKSKKGKPNGRKGLPISEKQKLAAIQMGINNIGKMAGGKNPSAKPISYNGIEYGCKTDLAKYLGISRKLLDYRIKKGKVEVSI